MQCPVCGALAKHFVESSEGISCACPRCGDYQVAESCFNSLLRLDLEGRMRALTAAKAEAKAGMLPTIDRIAPRSWWQRLRGLR
jgi:hypothetical protein